MKNISCIIVDDEKRSQNVLRQKIDDYCPGLKVLGICDSIRQAVTVIRETNPDIVFLDVEMPGEDGFELFKYVDFRTFHVIFITAHEAYGREAVNSDALAYLLKPCTAQDLKNAVEKARISIHKAYLYQGHKQNLNEIHGFTLLDQLDKNRLVLFNENEYEFHSLNNIIRMEASRAYTAIHLDDGRRIMSAKPLQSFDSDLKISGFLRIHKGHLININHVKRIKQRSVLTLTLSDNSVHQVARRRSSYISSVLFKAPISGSK